MKVQRKRRKKISKKVDTLKPIPQLTIDQLGTSDDPCFGKHFSPKADECSRCGDSEICAIMMMHKNKIKRAEIEAEQTFKDMEEEKEPLRADPIQVKKMVRARIKELSKKKMKVSEVISDIHATYNLQGYSMKRIQKIIGIMEEAGKVTVKNNILIWTA